MPLELQFTFHFPVLYLIGALAAFQVLNSLKDLVIARPEVIIGSDPDFLLTGALALLIGVVISVARWFYRGRAEFAY